MKTGIIIPCYNEAKRLDRKAFISYIRFATESHLCFVNDGSKDETMKVLESIKKKVPSRVSIIDLKQNQGKATAVRMGAKYLYECGDMAYIGFMDADLSTDFRDFNNLVRTLKSQDELTVVFGSRNMGGDGIERKQSRSILSNIIKQMILFILGLPIKDTQCGAKVFKRSIIPVAYGKSFVSRWLFDVEIFIRLKHFMGKKNVMNHILEQPLDRWVHVDDSKLGMKDAIQIPSQLLNIWGTYVRTNAFRLIDPTNPEIALKQDPVGLELSVAA